MNHRFETDKHPSLYRNIFLSIIFFGIAIGLFLTGVSTLSDKTDSKEAETLTNAITRDISRCYALEGAYPQDIDYLIENYGLVYNRDRFFIDYRPYGSNIMPDVTIIDKEAAN